MDNYKVQLYPQAYRDIDNIYSYIANNLSEPAMAEKLVNAIESAILSLNNMPERGAIRKNGIYANQDYRQLLIKNYLVIYRVLKAKKEVHIITIKYAKSNF